MFDWIESLVLGAVQGVTEFLPVSSDGHLTVAQRLFALASGRERSGGENLFFDIMLHAGTLTAILVYYRRSIRKGFWALANRSTGEPGFDRSTVLRSGFLAIAATLPLAPYKVFHLLDKIKPLFQSTTAAALGFLVTAVALVTTSALKGGAKGPRETTYLDAVCIGLAQALAPLPGVSRSGLTIATGLALGLSRSWSVGFSLLIAVPAIAGATASELLDAHRLALDADRVRQTIAAAVVAGLVGYFAIAWLTGIVRSGKIWYFSVYLVVLAIVALMLPKVGRDDPNPENRENALDRPAVGARLGPGVRAGGLRGALSRAFHRGERTGEGGLALGDRSTAIARDRTEGLDLARTLARRPSRSSDRSQNAEAPLRGRRSSRLAPGDRPRASRRFFGTDRSGRLLERVSPPNSREHRPTEAG